MALAANIARGSSIMALLIMTAMSTFNIAHATALTPSPNDTVVLADSTAAIIDNYNDSWTLTSGGQIAVNGTTMTSTSNMTELALVNGVVWGVNKSGNWYSFGIAPKQTAGPTKTSPLPTISPNKTIVLAASTTAIIDSKYNSWTITSGAQIAVNGTTISFTAAVTEIAYVNGVIWQLGGGSWYSLAMVAGVATTTAGPISTSPLAVLTPSANDTVVLAGTTTAIIDSKLNAWTITSGGQMAVNGTAITVTNGVTELAYVNSVVWQYNGVNWYSVATVNGATTTFSSGTTTSPLPTSSTAVPLGLAGSVVATSNYTNSCGTSIPSGNWAGPSTALWDAQWDQVTALMGRAPTIVTTYLNQAGTAESNWAASAQIILTCANEANGYNYDPIGQDTRTNGASGTIPQVGWPFGNQSTGAPNYFSNIANGVDDSLITNVLGQFKTAGYTKLILRPAWEMNGNWMGWSINSGNAAEFILAWEHFYTVVHAYAAANGMNIQIAFCPNVGDYTGLQLTQWVPPAAYIDIYSIDDYGGYTPSAADTSGGKDWLPTVMVAYAKAAGKPISGSEIGGLGATWVQNYVGYLATAGVPISFLDFWDSNTPTPLNVAGGTASWTNPSDAYCNNSTSEGTWSGAGGTSLCGAQASGSPTPGTVAYYWWLGLNAASGSISANQ